MRNIVFTGSGLAALVAASSAAIAQGAQAAPKILPQDLSPWAMFQNADFVVKSVLIGLAFASVVTWTVAIAKGFEILLARRSEARALSALHTATGLNNAKANLNDAGTVVAALVEGAAAEWQKSADFGLAATIQERAALLLKRREAQAGRRMARGTGVLATIGATAPFVGLFGTVWGIMNSFVGISKAQTTNLAIVAPGIAEALLATAIGLAAAIPAVVAYNLLARGIAGYRAELADATAEILRLLGRDLDRAAAGDGERAPRRAAD